MQVRNLLRPQFHATPPLRHRKLLLPPRLDLGGVYTWHETFVTLMRKTTHLQLPRLKRFASSSRTGGIKHLQRPPRGMLRGGSQQGSQVSRVRGRPGAFVADVMVGLCRLFGPQKMHARRVVAAVPCACSGREVLQNAPSLLCNAWGRRLEGSAAAFRKFVPNPEAAPFPLDS